MVSTKDYQEQINNVTATQIPSTEGMCHSVRRVSIRVAHPISRSSTTSPPSWQKPAALHLQSFLKFAHFSSGVIQIVVDVGTTITHDDSVALIVLRLFNR